MRIALITLWTFCSFWGWILGVVAAVRALAWINVRAGRPPVPQWLEDAVPHIAFAIFGVGTVIVTVAVLLLGMRGKLPGTAKRRATPRGFAVEPTATEADRLRPS